MGRRISFSLQEALANPAVSINLSTEVLEGDPDSEPGSDRARDTYLTSAAVTLKVDPAAQGRTQVFELWFNDGRPELSRDFNAWGSSYSELQTFIDALGVAYHVC